MEHPCSKCGAVVQDGTPFCSNCGAPQIRVANPFGDAPATAPLPPGTPGEIQPPAQPSQPWANQQGFRSPFRFEWASAWRSAITVGVVIGILSAVPLVGALCCLWMLGGGAISVFHYRRSTDQPIVPVSVGFRLGMLSGLVGFSIKMLADLGKLIAGGGAAERVAFREAIDRSLARNPPDPRAAEMVRNMVEWMQSPQGFAIMFTASMLMIGIAFILFTGLGGALGASLFGKRSDLR